MIKKLIYLILLIFCSIKFRAQTYTMPVSTTGAVATSITTCSGTFYDDGGSAVKYSNNQNSIQTFCSSSGQIKFTFTSFNTQATNDVLSIYDGPTTASPLIGSYSGAIAVTTIGSAGVVTSTNGCITFKFVSNNSTIKAGWAATISCVAGNDECSNATTLTVNTACSYTNGSTVGASNSTSTPAPTCANFTSGTSTDVWYKFVATSTNHTIGSNTGTITDGGMALYSGTCTGLTLIECDDDDSPNGLMPQIQRADFIVGQTYFIRFWAYSTTTTGTFDICVTAPGVITCPSGLGTGYQTIASLPFSDNSQTTCGDVNDLTSSNVTTCGSTSYYTGEDYVYIFTPTSSGQMTINLTSTGTWTGLMLYAGCPVNGGTCVANEQSSSGNKSMCVTVTNGVTYYLVIDSYASPTCNPYSISFTAPSGIPAGTTCANAIAIASLPYNINGETTACYGNDYSTASIGSCNTSYESGEDKVYSYTSASSECISITLNNTSTSSIGFQVYSGCPGTVGTVCVGNAGGASSGTLSGSVVLPSAGTYYIIIDTWASPNNANYDLSISSFGSGQSNDLPCNAVNLILGTSETGNTNCTGDAGEPATPACWTAGNRNTVWYKVTTMGTSLKIRTYPGSLTNTQIAVYSGVCGSGMSLVSGGCNDNSGTCGSLTNEFSELSLTGLTASTTYYIAVDGASNSVGSFTIYAIDGASSLPTVYGMDCIEPNPVCSQNFTVSDPGYAGFGSTCDLPSSYCLASSERNISWYRIPINANGNLVFDIVPNDFNFTLETETDYDFAIWKITGTGSVTCSQIASGAAIPIECNYNSSGVTGLNHTADGDAPNSLSSSVCPTCGSYNPDPTYDLAYQSQITVSNGDVYLLGVSNFSNSTSGFKIDFKTSPIGYVGSTATSVTWSGGTSTAAELSGNWGGCNAPSCTVDGVIVPFTNQPVVTTNMTFKDLYIQPGASLTVSAGVTLTICGNFTNLGTLNCSPTSTILFNNNGAHIMSGSFIGNNAIGNLTCTATGTSFSVTCNNDLELNGNFTTSNADSKFNLNNNNFKIAGNFLNSNGTSTFLNSTTNTFEFDGNSTQNYDPTVNGGTNLTLNNVITNNTRSGFGDITLFDDLLIGSTSTTGTLTLVAGDILTNSFKVQVNNVNTTSVSTGNIASFVNGNLRRYLSTSGTYDWPLGNTSKGYQRANTNFTTCSIGFIDAFFSNWPSTPPTQGGTDCGTTFNQPAQDNGFWTLNANSGTGNYNLTLYPLNSTNTSGMSGWTIIKDPTISSNTWSFNGTCVLASTVSQVMRNGMSGFSVFGIAQSLNPLPVELLYFKGKRIGVRNFLEWSTASETNNDFFTLERSENGVNFESLTIIDGGNNSNQILNYNTYDNYPYDKVTYYRLKQTDFNAENSYSDIITIFGEIAKNEIKNIHPNPTSSNLSFDVYAVQDDRLLIELYDCLGRLIISQEKLVKFGLSSESIIIEDLYKGIYTMKISFKNNALKSVTKIIKN